MLFFWGRLWNKQWTIGDHLVTTTTSLLLAVIGATSVYLALVTHKAFDSIENQRAEVSQTISSNGKFNREVLLATWAKIAHKGGQEGLTPPSEGGNELRINGPAEALVLSTTAAELASQQRRDFSLFSSGIQEPEISPELTGSRALAEVGFPSSDYPVIVSPANIWTSTAVTVGTGRAVDKLLKELAKPFSLLQTIALVALGISLMSQLLIVATTALNDIKETL
ncbi:hypothetical protein [Sulfuriroseicoccus oceanibius]|uniref:Uncharacterized protein n=1 Tax=Sulfuriroseicoccus oceanibius TaxID=2707525 RepID=A0A7T7EZ56_9BACT|nr:hypothetical protein [Sulfuriroseicoccus oceanibius]QQL43762.1 hypothetical protein G3M56_007565 [Sulfuriroseicoccus oceanibius]